MIEPANLAGVGLTGALFDTQVELEDDFEMRFVVRYTGRSGDGTLRFAVRRTLVDVQRGKKSGSIYASVPIPRVNPMTSTQYFECYVPVDANGVATAHWCFGEADDDRILEHYRVTENGDLEIIGEPGSKDDGKKRRRMGFRIEYE